MKKSYVYLAVILLILVVFAIAPNIKGHTQQVKVISASGAAKYLNPADRPVLFFAPWCHLCDDVLKEIAKLPQEKQPVLVGALLRSKSEVQSALVKAQNAGLSGNVYFTDLDPGSVPALLTKNSRYIKDPAAICSYLKGGNI
ncbi:hypothetical protein [Desulfotruncus alcoholivorax]|uniref:hypothetical protein n=1 Tax=Desulfotruncus alcoholivorax TaxID=265477 RepID=UPI0004139085|nr:hypothetical protein [Desulfotruncus alcoholivorax]